MRVVVGDHIPRAIVAGVSYDQADWDAVVEEEFRQHEVHRSIGASSEDLLAEELRIWEKYKDQAEPDIFSFLKLAKDGGFSEVRGLYTPSRWITVAFLCIFIVYNVLFVIKMDVSFIIDPYAALHSMGATDYSVAKDFYFSSPIINWILSTVTGNEDAFLSPVRVIGILELIGLSYYFFHIAFCIYHIKTDRNEGYYKWYNIQFVSWWVFQDLTSYSAMKLLQHIVPVIVSTRLFELIEDVSQAKRQGKSPIKPYFEVFVWICTMIFGFVVGFDTFLMKLRVVSVKANTPHMSFWNGVLPLLQFLVQLLGVVQLGPFVRKRLFLFIFGGEDGVMQDKEKELMDTWNAMLARRMYTDLPFSHFLAVLLSFSDEDFQSLVLNEDEEQKEVLSRLTARRDFRGGITSKQDSRNGDVSDMYKG